MQPNQVEIDEALAASLLYDDPESIIYDEVTLAKEWQDMEGNPQISLSDDEKYAKMLQEEELNGSTSLHCGSSSHQQGHVGGSIDTSSHSFQPPPPSGDVDPDNMTYEENQLERSTKDCPRVQSIKYQRINLARVRGLERKLLAPEKLSKNYFIVLLFRV
ncbi:PREDICTED: uncharacterized protein LOC106323499 [Brassica oleracea var. oleracea]|uniref:uncharacterized protein LOC106323499 n=1 Tax=Brassica oleracea var. oleracea TaxID=109376 RepID=UPI0006A6B1E0|nr:PREDICTED: uncharacterized protein LOC106323499 [Brassica oleracea var. oleracea]